MLGHGSSSVPICVPGHWSSTAAFCGSTSIRPLVTSRWAQSRPHVCARGTPTLVSAGVPGPSTVAKSYRLLHGILQTAVQDGLVARNPCAIRGAGVERPKERPVVGIAEVFAIAEAIDGPYRGMVLLATFAGLRLGELRALRRRNLDLEALEVAVVEQYQQLSDGSLVAGPPKSDAGYRRVRIPSAIGSDLEDHLAKYAREGSDELVFTGTKGQPVRLASFYRAWRRAVLAVGLDELRFHDLRHSGNTLAAATGASTKELMSRMGHVSPRAALIYQHATVERDAAIADALDQAITRSMSDRERTTTGPRPSRRDRNSPDATYS